MAEEKITAEELAEKKKNAWDNFKNWINAAEYDKLEEQDILEAIQGFHGDMSEQLPKEIITIPVTNEEMAEHPYWGRWQILTKKIGELGGKIPANPDKVIWTDRRTGILGRIKEEVKEFGEEFMDPRFLKNSVVRAANRFLAGHPKFEGQIDASTSIKEAQEMVEKTYINPQLETLKTLEEKIKGA